MKFLLLALALLTCLHAQDVPGAVAGEPQTPAIAEVDVQPTVASMPIAPPDWTDRRRVFFKKLFGPQALLETVPGTIFDTARNFPNQWGRTTRGTAKRLGSQYGQFLVGETIELAVSAIHSEDPRYFRMPDASMKKRIGHALVSTVVVRKADGKGNTIALARLADVYGAWAVATLWSPPDQRNFKAIATWGTFGLTIKAASNVFCEFWPDIRKAMKHH